MWFRRKHDVGTEKNGEYSIDEQKVHDKIKQDTTYLDHLISELEKSERMHTESVIWPIEDSLAKLWSEVQVEKWKRIAELIEGHRYDTHVRVESQWPEINKEEDKYTLDDTALGIINSAVEKNPEITYIDEYWNWSNPSYDVETENGQPVSKINQKKDVVDSKPVQNNTETKEKKATTIKEKGYLDIDAMENDPDTVNFVLFSANWCWPCRQMEKTINQNSFDGANFIKRDIEKMAPRDLWTSDLSDNVNTIIEKLENWKSLTVPTTLVISGWKVQDTFQWSKSANELKNVIKNIKDSSNGIVQTD